MFAGIVEELALVVCQEPMGPGTHLTVLAGRCAEGTKIGDSIAVNGCCLTVVGRDGAHLSFDVGPESLRRTNLGFLAAGSQVNLERSLQLGERVGGHLVTGHIDAVGTVTRRTDQGEWCEQWFRVPQRLCPELVSKGSVAVDGVSLTVVDLVEDTFSVALIPHTLQVTTLGRCVPGSQVNIETDLVGKYIRRQFELYPRPDRPSE